MLGVELRTWLGCRSMSGPSMMGGGMGLNGLNPSGINPAMHAPGSNMGVPPSNIWGYGGMGGMPGYNGMLDMNSMHMNMGPGMVNMQGMNMPAMRQMQDYGSGRGSAMSGLPNTRPGDWVCPACNDHNYASRTMCRQCQAPKPAQGMLALFSLWA
jgi:hypothetical protein